MRFAWMIVLGACGGSPTPPPALISNQAPPSSVAIADEKPMIRGRVVDMTNQPLPGATVVIAEVDNARMPDELVALTDNDGRYAQPVSAGRAYEVTFYYADKTLRRSRIEVHGTTLVDQQIDEQASSASGVLECTSALASSCR